MAARPQLRTTLVRLAYGYARLASALNDGEFGESFAALSEA